MMKPRFVLFLFVLIATFHLLGHVLSLHDWITYSKPILMPMLLLFVYTTSKHKVKLETLWLALALIFSWIGDVALMYPEQYFLYGVGAFFLAHVFYIIVFTKAINGKLNFKPLPLILAIGFGLISGYLILPFAGELTLPLSIYAAILIGNVIFAAAREGRTFVRSFRLTLTGSVLFLISDTLLAYNKFVSEITDAGFYIMLTYISAQALLTVGVLWHIDQSA